MKKAFKMNKLFSIYFITFEWLSLKQIKKNFFWKAWLESPTPSLKGKKEGGE